MLGRSAGEGHILGFSHLPPPPRSHLAEATALYSLMDEQLHVLVTASNHLLGRLELRVRLGRLEAAILQVKGEACLGEVAASAWPTPTGKVLFQAVSQPGTLPWCKDTRLAVLQRPGRHPWDT